MSRFDWSGFAASFESPAQRFMHSEASWLHFASQGLCAQTLRGMATATIRCLTTETLRAEGFAGKVIARHVEPAVEGC